MHEPRTIYYGDGWFVSCRNDDDACVSEAIRRQEKEERYWRNWLVVMLVLIAAPLPVLFFFG